LAIGNPVNTLEIVLATKLASKLNLYVKKVSLQSWQVSQVRQTSYGCCCCYRFLLVSSKKPLFSCIDKKSFSSHFVFVSISPTFYDREYWHSNFILKSKCFWSFWGVYIKHHSLLSLILKVWGCACFLWHIIEINTGKMLYDTIFRTKVLCTVCLYLQLAFEYFGGKIGGKLLVKCW